MPSSLVTVTVLPGVPFAFGNSVDIGNAQHSFKGSMDEIRIRNGAVSDDWAFAEYATVADRSFLTATGLVPPGTMLFVW